MYILLNINKISYIYFQVYFRKIYFKKINNFFEDIDNLNEDNMQKLNLKPTPIYQPNKRITFEKRKKYALQKKKLIQKE